MGVVEAPQRSRVLVVDDDPNFVEAAQSILAADERLEVVGEAANGEEAVARAAVLQPDVVAMDVSMPVMDGIVATRAILESLPDCHVVLVSGSIFVGHDDEAVETALAAGAPAYVQKSRAGLDLAAGGVSVPQPGLGRKA